MSKSYQPVSFKEIVGLAYSKINKLILLPLVIAIVAAIATLFMDNVYRSTASVLPAQDRSFGIESLIGGRIGGLASSLIGGGRSGPFDRYLVLLNSESVKLKVITEFDLVNVYKKDTHPYPMTETKRELDRNTNFRGQAEGNFIIEVLDKDPTRAKQMVEFYLNILNDFSNELNISDARAYREFIQQRYDRAFTEVDSIRSRMSAFQREYGVYELPEQLKAYFTIIGEITAEQLQAQIAVDILQNTVGVNSTAYAQAKQKLDVINDNLDKAYGKNNNNPLFLDLNLLPEIGLKYFELLQQIELQTEILKFVVPMYEQALLEEQKALPTVSVVDYPQIAERKDKPFRSLIVIATLLSAFILIFSVLVIQFMYQKNTEYFKDLVKGQ
jgi:tyrosine-protein kinase Etk/Wzc